MALATMNLIDKDFKLVKRTATEIEAADGPLFILAFIGSGRGGKSSLANAVVRHLTNGGIDAAFDVGHTTVRATVGIDCVLLPHARGQYLVLDCEGCDATSGVNDGRIFAFATRVASVVIAVSADEPPFGPRMINMLARAIVFTLAANGPKLSPWPLLAAVVNKRMTTSRSKPRELWNAMLAPNPGDSGNDHDRKAIQKRFPNAVPLTIDDCDEEDLEAALDKAASDIARKALSELRPQSGVTAQWLKDAQKATRDISNPPSNAEIARRQKEKEAADKAAQEKAAAILREAERKAAEAKRAQQALRDAEEAQRRLRDRFVEAAETFSGRSGYGPDNNLPIERDPAWFGLAPAGKLDFTFQGDYELCITVHHAWTGEKLLERGNYSRTDRSEAIAEGTPIVIAAWHKFSKPNGRKPWVQCRRYRRAGRDLGWNDDGNEGFYRNIVCSPLEYSLI